MGSKTVKKQPMIDKLLRKNIKKLKAYSSAREDFKGNASIYLDANENPFENGVNRYPDPFQSKLRKKLAEIKGIPQQNLMLGNGSDEVLDLVFRSFVESGEENIIICPPTYGMYKVWANINNVEVKEVPLHSDFSLDTKGILENIDKKTKLLILCSPNNPTGNSIPLQDIEFLCLSSNLIVLLDEAYIDFSAEESAISLIEKYPNLIVSQTLSKAWGMAAIRLGMAVAQENIIQILDKVKPPYNVNALTQQKALEMISERHIFDEKLQKLKQEKDFLVKELNKIDLVTNIFPSDANFLLVRFTDANKIYEQLSQKGVIVRNRSKELHCENCLRITVGRPKQNKTLIRVLKNIN